MSTVSVIVPSIPSRSSNGLLLKALVSISKQSTSVQVILAVEKDTEVPEEAWGLIDEVVEAPTQSAKVNLAASVAKGDYLAILHDDDMWHPHFLKTALPVLRDVEFVTSTSLEVDENGEVIRIDDYPNPSGWIMRREVFFDVGPWSDAYRWHPDTDWLGRLGERISSRAHLIESTAPIDPVTINQARHGGLLQDRPGLCFFLRYSRPTAQLTRHSLPIPLVTKRHLNESIMYRVAYDRACQAQSNAEQAKIRARYGFCPW